MIHVFGHTHPDSDAICSAAVAAWVLILSNRPARAWRLGEANRETTFIFEQAGLPLPDLLTASLEGEQVWLVDFSEPAQGPDTLWRSNIIGITDHHRLGGLVTHEPPEVCIRPLGSTATLIWITMHEQLRHKLPPAYAILLLGAILSDTLNLRSPTTTGEDIHSVAELAVLTGVNRRRFARDLLCEKTNLSGLTPQDILDRDLKAFVIAGTDVRIAQVEINAISQILPMIDELHQAMASLADQTGAGLIVLMLTDITNGYSTLYFAGRESPYAASCSVPGMLSRKKQLLPWLENFLRQNRSQL